jgi:cytochrome c oxidase cbb3-type subunit 3
MNTRAVFLATCGLGFLILSHGAPTLRGDDKADGEASAKRDAELIAAAKDQATVKAGKATYTSLCLSCHGDAKATGDSPTNLFDATWYHGGRPNEIEHTVLQGVIEKGMPGWGAVLPPEDTTAVTAFILSFQK